MKIMVTSPFNSRWFVAFAVVWQLMVYLLSCAGIFGDIYWLIGIPWTATGLTNVIGTTVGLILLELPVLTTATVFALRGKRKIDEASKTSDDH